MGIGSGLYVCAAPMALFQYIMPLAGTIGQAALTKSLVLSVGHGLEYITTVYSERHCLTSTHFLVDFAQKQEVQSQFAMRTVSTN